MQCDTAWRYSYRASFPPTVLTVSGSRVRATQLTLSRIRPAPRRHICFCVVGIIVGYERIVKENMEISRATVCVMISHRPVGVANLATRWHEVPSPPLKGEVPNEREAEGFCLQSTYHVNPSDSPFGLSAFNCGMIATGNHNFERFAALCNTLSVEPRRLRRSGRQVGDPYRERCKIIGLYHPTHDTPSASLRSAAPSGREPRRLRRSGRQVGDPYSGIVNYFSRVTISFPSRVNATVVFSWVRL